MVEWKGKQPAGIALNTPIRNCFCSIALNSFMKPRDNSLTIIVLCFFDDLQILGAESGWKPIPLTDLVSSASVRKAYRKATLYVHPDKLQQRGASTQQKYICEKVFDLLKVCLYFLKLFDISIPLELSPSAISF